MRGGDGESSSPPVTGRACRSGHAALSFFNFNVFEFASILDDLFPTLRYAVTAAHEEYQNQARALGEA